MISPHDLLAAHHQEARQRHLSDHERTALALRKAQRMQRWADRLRRLSERMSRTARLRMARLP